LIDPISVYSVTDVVERVGVGVEAIATGEQQIIAVPNKLNHSAAADMARPDA